MSLPGWLQIGFVLIVVLLLVKPLGLYMACVFTGERTLLSAVLGPVERGFYALAGVRTDKEQGWLGHAMGVLLFSLVGIVVLYALLRLQNVLPLNPQALPAARRTSPSTPRPALWVPVRSGRQRRWRSHSWWPISRPSETAFDAWTRCRDRLRQR